MVQRLQTPGGTLGVLSLVSAFLLAMIGLVGVWAMVMSLVLGDFWSDQTSDVIVALVSFTLVLFGAVGFAVEDRAPRFGAVLAVVGGTAAAVLMYWAVLPVFIGLGAAAVAVVRARALQHGTTAAPAVVA